MFPRIGVGPQNGWFMMDDLGVPLFLETPILRVEGRLCIQMSFCITRGAS